MPEAAYFMKMTGAMVLGIVTLALSIVLALIVSPYIVPLLEVLFPYLGGFVLVILSIVIVWAVLFLCAMLGVFIYYFFKPMKVNTKSKGYSMNAKESGRRQKGKKKVNRN